MGLTSRSERSELVVDGGDHARRYAHRRTVKIRDFSVLPDAIFSSGEVKVETPPGSSATT
jgi:hypothetical protein